MVDFSKVLAALEDGVKFAEGIVPMIAELTPYGALATTAIKAVGAVTETVQNVQERMNEGSIVAHSSDQEQVRDLAQRLHDLNDQIAEQIDKT